MQKEKKNERDGGKGSRREQNQPGNGKEFANKDIKSYYNMFKTHMFKTFTKQNVLRHGRY